MAKCMQHYRYCQFVSVMFPTNAFDSSFQPIQLCPTAPCWQGFFLHQDLLYVFLRFDSHKLQLKFRSEWNSFLLLFFATVSAPVILLISVLHSSPHSNTSKIPPLQVDTFHGQLQSHVYGHHFIYYTPVWIHFPAKWHFRFGVSKLPHRQLSCQESCPANTVVLGVFAGSKC